MQVLIKVIHIYHEGREACVRDWADSRRSISKSRSRWKLRSRSGGGQPKRQPDSLARWTPKTRPGTSLAYDSPSLHRGSHLQCMEGGISMAASMRTRGCQALRREDARKLTFAYSVLSMHFTINELQWNLVSLWINTIVLTIFQIWSGSEWIV